MSSAETYESLRRKATFLRYPWIPVVMALLGLPLFVWMAANLALQGPLYQLDPQLGLRIWQYTQGSPQWFQLVNEFFAAMGMYTIALVGVALAIYWTVKKEWRKLSMLLVGVLGGFLMFLAIGFLFGRGRPDYPNLVPSRLPTPSFPSGHVLSSVDFYGLLAYLYAPRLRSNLQRALLGLGTLLLVLLIALSRIMLARHFITDVIAGLGFGLFWSALVYTSIDAYLLRRLREDGRQSRAHKVEA